MKLNFVPKLFKKQISANLLIFISSLLLLFFYNFKYFSSALNIYNPSATNLIYLASTALIILLTTNLIIQLFSFKKTIKPLLIFVFITSSLAAYFMDTYNIIIDDEMIRNTFATDFNETLDLISYKLFLYLFILGILPSFLILNLKPIFKSIKNQLLTKLITTVITLATIIILFFSFSQFYTSYIREHISLRLAINPLNWIYGTGEFLSNSLSSPNQTIKQIGIDAKIIKQDDEANKIVILVVGEAARADRFSLNGYEKQTNPLLEKRELINFSNMYSCGTSTAHSVPCMFSPYTRSGYSYKKARLTENILDVLNHTKEVSILWRDANSDSKGVALRVDYEDYKRPALNTLCDTECRDVGMLVGLEDYISNHSNKDILIVLHQMGNHGPAYYKRYPQEFEKFQPVCKTNQLEKCSQEEVSNAYDNAILYTDYFLNEALNLLDNYNKTHKTALFYLADHGESLGENGLYLHGIPYPIAPKEQKHIGSFLWLNNLYEQNFNLNKLKSYKDKEFSHDYLFHTLISLFSVKTEIYNPELDILFDSKNEIQ